jgi:hypothetical protein
VKRNALGISFRRDGRGSSLNWFRAWSCLKVAIVSHDVVEILLYPILCYFFTGFSKTEKFPYVAPLEFVICSMSIGSLETNILSVSVPLGSFSAYSVKSLIEFGSIRRYSFVFAAYFTEFLDSS